MSADAVLSPVPIKSPMLKKSVNTTLKFRDHGHYIRYHYHDVTTFELSLQRKGWW
jgi:hypothetical protein